MNSSSLPPSTESGAVAPNSSSPPETTLSLAALEAIRALQSPGAPDLVARVINLYFDSAPKLIADMHAAEQSASADALRLAAHTLKSSSANVGAIHVTSLAKRIEAAARAGNFEAARAPLAELSREYEKAKAALAQQR